MAEQLHRMRAPRVRARGDRGSVIPLVAATIVMLLVMVAFAVDLGNAHQNKGFAQSTTDSAALAGAQALAGVKNGGTPQGGVTQPVYDAANWAFKNLSLTLPPPTTSCDGNTNKTCYLAGDAANTKVEITTPYTTSKTQPDGSAYPASEVLHVKTCWDNETFIARIVGISTIRVCSEATAWGHGVLRNTDSEDELNDPFARCPSDTAIFDTAHWFPSSNPSKDIPGKNNYGATFLFTTNLDPASVVFTIGGTEPFTIGGQASSKVHEFFPGSPYVSIVPKPAPDGGPDAQGRYKWELKFTNFTALDSNGNGKDAKNFKDTLPDGIYSFAIYATTVGGVQCNQTVFPVAIGSSKKAATGICQEDLFRGGTTPPSGTMIGPNDSPTVTATYYDETPPFVTSSTDANVRSHMMHFEIKGGAFTDWTDATADVLGNPLTDDDPILNPNGAHEYKWKQRYAYTIPSSYLNSEYSFRIQVYDSDQNKAGGDCGFAIWTVRFAAGVDGKVQLIE